VDLPLRSRASHLRCAGPRSGASFPVPSSHRPGGPHRRPPPLPFWPRPADLLDLPCSPGVVSSLPPFLLMLGFSRDLLFFSPWSVYCAIGGTSRFNVARSLSPLFAHPPSSDSSPLLCLFPPQLRFSSLNPMDSGLSPPELRVSGAFKLVTAG